jgi:hypothetical protein
VLLSMLAPADQRRLRAYIVPTICPQLHMSLVISGDVFAQVKPFVRLRAGQRHVAAVCGLIFHERRVNCEESRVRKWHR